MRKPPHVIEVFLQPGEWYFGDRQTRMRTLLGNLMNRLDRREQFILRGRFALGSHRAVRTFQCLADRLGVSKVRVRQLERRAVAKLQAMARQIDPAA